MRVNWFGRSAGHPGTGGDPQSWRIGIGGSVPCLLERLEERTMLAAAWTVMSYFDADNNLETYQLQDFRQLAQVGSSAKVNLVVQLDRIGGYSTMYDNWTSTRRGLVAAGSKPDRNWGQSIAEADMGDRQTLADFINWAAATYPANRYALILNDHGQGWSGACSDDSDDDYLTLTEFRGALADAATPPDLVAFDACLMSGVEVLHAASDAAGVFVGSAKTMNLGGYDYDQIADALVKKPSMGAAQLGAQMVAIYGNRGTMAAFDLAGLKQNGFFTQLSALAADMAAGTTGDVRHLDNIRRAAIAYDTAFGSEFRDLTGFLTAVVADNAVSVNIRDDAQAALSTLTAGVISHVGKGGGLSVYLPQPGTALPQKYANIPFAADTQWDEFLTWWQTADGDANAGQWTAATPIAVNAGSGRGAVAGALDSAGDTDLFTFTATASGRTTIRLTPEVALDVVLNVYDGKGRPITRIDFAWAGGMEKASFVAKNKLKYYILVEPRLATSGTYDLEVQCPPKP